MSTLQSFFESRYKKVLGAPLFIPDREANALKPEQARSICSQIPSLSQVLNELVLLLSAKHGSQFAGIGGPGEWINANTPGRDII